MSIVFFATTLAVGIGLVFATIILAGYEYFTNNIVKGVAWFILACALIGFSAGGLYVALPSAKPSVEVIE